jgi:hypothetical protein
MSFSRGRDSGQRLSTRKGGAVLRDGIPLSKKRGYNEQDVLRGSAEGAARNAIWEENHAPLINAAASPDIQKDIRFLKISMIAIAGSTGFKVEHL